MPTFAQGGVRASMFTCGPVPMNQAFGSDTPRGTGGAVDGAGAGTKPPGPMDSAAGAKQPGENTAAGAGTEYSYR